MGVHEVIRYLPYEPKRMLWVGGGDAMFLHEILKYPSLELAVGLELDQKVVRGAFQHFGVQPHWDNEKVQWWFGDASKSLLMLPEDYYGSFDVVLVDLSDTVLSLSVTKEMDIIGALSLLLKPSGVFAMNELVCLLRRLAALFLICFVLFSGGMRF
jgi:spermidine synthase